MIKEVYSREIHGAKSWLFRVVLVALVNYLTVFPGLAIPDPVASFNAVIQSTSGRYPPDTNGAVSREFVMTPTNDDVLVQDKFLGAHVSSASLSAFWSDVCATPNCRPCDPVVVFDPYTNRWFFISRADGGLDLLIAASMNSDPSVFSHWWKNKITPDVFGLLDQPKIGFNRKWVVVQEDVLDILTEIPRFSVIFVFDKIPLMAGTPLILGQNYTVIQSSETNQGAFMSPARTYDASLPDLFLLQSSKNNASQVINSLTYYTISGESAASATLSGGTPVVLENNSWVRQGPPAPQLGISDTIRDDDDRIHSCIYRNGCLWTAHTVFLPVPTPAFSTVQWWQIIPAPSATPAASPAIVQHGVIAGSSGDGNFRAFPSLAVNANENVLIGYAFFSSYLYPSGAYSFRLGTDPPNALQTGERYCGVGQGPYRPVADNPPAPYRWGDFSAAVVDPTDDRSMWTVQEFSGPAPTMTPVPVTTTQDSSTITAPIDTFSEALVGAAISGPGIPDGSFIGAFHTSSSVDLYDAATGAPVNATASDTVEAIIGDVSYPFRFWATHWISIALDFGRFVAGQGHSLGQDPVSTTALAASGLNDYGQLGNNSNMNANQPVSAGGSLIEFGRYKIMDVAAGFHNSLAVDNQGTVFVWGSNQAGQLGNGSTDSTSHSTPAPVPCATALPCWSGKFNLFKQDNGQPYYVPVSTGFGISPTLVSFKLNACAVVDYLGQVWMWGYNDYGQLGNGTTAPHYVPALVRELGEVPYPFTGVVSIETGNDMTIALKTDGSVWSWGSGCFGALGDGDTSCPFGDHIRVYPQPVLKGLGQPLTGVVQVACGRASDFCLALTQDGTVYGWGANGSSQLALGDAVNRGYATLIPNFTGIRRIAAGGYHSLALASDGRVYAWGQNSYGQCGLGITTGRAQATPRLMAGTNSGYTDIAAGNNFSLMIRGGTQPVPQVWGTGDNVFGQLAKGNNVPNYTLPTQTLY